MSSFPATGQYAIRNFPHDVTSPVTYMNLRLDKLEDAPNYRFKFYMTMHCHSRAWSLMDRWSYSFIIEFYDNNNNKIGETAVVNKRLIYKPVNDIASNWNSGVFYNWNIVNWSQISSCRALGLIEMSYSAAKNTAIAEGISMYSGCLAAAEPFGIRYASDDGTRKVYSTKGLDYSLHPSNVASTASWSSNQGFGRPDVDQGVEVTFNPPSNAAYFKGRVEWYDNNTRKDYYIFPDNTDIPEDQILDNSSKVYNKRGGWQDDAKVWLKTNGVWEKKHTFNKQAGAWKQI